MRPQYENLTGKRFGSLIVEEPVRCTQTGVLKWQCRCDCGNVVKVIPYSLKKPVGGTRSCGCRRERPGGKAASR